MIGTLRHIGKQLVNCIKCYIYQILYIIMLGILWTYIILNWEKCVSMKFFSQFDGNNILFLVGILLVVLPFYEVEGKGFKVRRIGIKALEEDIQNEESKFQKYQIDNTIIMMQNQKTQTMQSQVEATENNELPISK